MKKYFLLILSLISLSCFAAGKNPDLTGSYTCKGHDPFANIDFQAALVVKKTGETYQFEWDLGEKFGKYLGTGFYVEGINNFIPITVVSLKKSDSNNPYNSELQIYRIGRDGSLSGRWTFLGKDTLSPVETCTKVSANH